MIEGIFVRTDDNLPVVFEPKTAHHHLVLPGQRLDIWIGGGQYISGYYAPGYDENGVLTDHLWHAHPGGGYMYLAGRAERQNGEMEVRLHEEILPNPPGLFLGVATSGGPGERRRGGPKDHSRLQQRYRSGEMGDLAPGVCFRPAVTYKDVMAVIRMNNELFGESKRVSDDEFVRHRLSWLEQNPEVIHVLEVRRKIVGFVSLLPLLPEVIGGVLSSKIGMSGIEAKDIQRYQPGEPYDLFVWTLGVDKSLQGQRKRFYGTYLVMGVWQLFNDWGERGIQIRTVFAMSNEVDGMNISHELGLHAVPPPPGARKTVFAIHPIGEHQPFLLTYQQNLAGYYGGYHVSDSVP